MSSKAQKINPEIEERIREVIKTNREVIRQLQLSNQSLIAQLPSINKKPDEARGYFIDPRNGEKRWYDQKAKARYEKARKPLKLVQGGNNGKKD